MQETIGFSAERGDSVKVINAPFRVEKLDEPAELPLWKQPEVLDMLRTAALPATLAALALLIIFGVVRPALKAAGANATPRGRALDATVDDAEVLPALPGSSLPALAAPVSNDKLEAARQLAKDNPAAVANIVRNWVSKEAAA